MGRAVHGHQDAPAGRLAAWLAEVDQWKSALSALSGLTARTTASDLVTEDRRARR